MAFENETRANAAGLNLGAGQAPNAGQRQTPSQEEPRDERPAQEQTDIAEARAIIIELRAHIVSLERQLAQTRTTTDTDTNNPQGPSMVAEQVAIDRARAAAQAARREKPAVTLPPIEPGFKADPQNLRKSLPRLSLITRARRAHRHATVPSSQDRPA